MASVIVAVNREDLGSIWRPSELKKEWRVQQEFTRLVHIRSATSYRGHSMPALRLLDPGEWSDFVRSLSSGTNGVVMEGRMRAGHRSKYVIKTPRACDDGTYDCVDSLLFEFVTMVTASRAMKHAGYPFIVTPYAFGLGKASIVENPDKEGKYLLTNFGNAKDWRPMLMMENAGPAADIYDVTINLRNEYRKKRAAKDLRGAEVAQSQMLWIIINCLLVLQAGQDTCGLTHYDAHGGNWMVSDSGSSPQKIRVRGRVHTVPGKYMVRLIDFGRAYVKGRKKTAVELGYKDDRAWNGASQSMQRSIGVRSDKFHPSVDMVVLILSIAHVMGDSMPAIYSLKTHVLKLFPMIDTEAGITWGNSAYMLRPEEQPQTEVRRPIDLVRYIENRYYSKLRVYVEANETSVWGHERPLSLDEPAPTGTGTVQEQIRHAIKTGGRAPLELLDIRARGF